MELYRRYKIAKQKYKLSGYAILEDIIHEKAPSFIIIILFFIWSVSRYIPVDNLCVSSVSCWWSYFTYNFIHISFMHWLSNSIVFYIYYRALSRKDLYILFPLCIAFPALSAYLSVRATPTCGFSSVICVIMGYYISKCNYKHVIKSLLLIAFSFSFTALFAHGVNTFIHIYSFVFSLIFSFLYRRIYHACHRNYKS